jgi:5'-3' exonuclease
VGERVVLFDRRQRIVIDEAGVRAKYGVEPVSIPDLLALVGDEADGIPGIPRWGMKSAAAVLAHYRHLEAIPASASEWQVKVRVAEALADALAAQRADALLYKKLATLRRDVPLAAGVDDLRWRDVSADFAPLCNELGLAGLRDRLPAPRP